MKTRQHFLTIALAFSAALTGCEAGTEDVPDTEVGAELGEPETGVTDVGFAEWDADEDTYLGENEWGAYWADRGIYEDWDLNDDAGVDETEFGEGLFGAWDRDDDDIIREDEWTEGTDAFFGDADYGTFADWDADGDTELDLNEVSEGLESRNLYDTIDVDRDALIDDEELADWWFDVFDLDDDTRIDTTEWESTWLE